MTIESIELWHKRARPIPTPDDFRVQLGVHFEEIEEMMQTVITDDDAVWQEVRSHVHALAMLLKMGGMTAWVEDRKEFIDSIADQVVTAIGAAHCAGMRGAAACDQVNASNWSKFDDNGEPIRDASGKIAKGPKYLRPVLDGLY